MPKSPKKIGYFARNRALNEKKWQKIERAIDRTFGDGAAYKLSPTQKSAASKILPIVTFILSGIYTWWLPGAIQEMRSYSHEINQLIGTLDTPLLIILHPTFVDILSGALVLVSVVAFVITIGLFLGKKWAWRSCIWVVLYVAIISILNNVLIGVAGAIFLFYILAQTRTYFTK